jgi:hypothetical protein
MPNRRTLLNNPELTMDIKKHILLTMLLLPVCSSNSKGRRHDVLTLDAETQRAIV